MKLREFLENSSEVELKELLKIINENSFEKNDEIVDSGIIYYLHSALTYAEFPHENKIHIIFEMFDLFPRYSVLGWLSYKEAYKKYSENKVFWDYIFFYLSKDREKYGKEICYWLWVNPFEGSDTEIEVCWDILCSNIENETYLKNIFDIMGPIPINLKIPFIKKIIDRESFHEDIFKIIKDSFFDLFGKFDYFEFPLILKSLKI